MCALIVLGRSCIIGKRSYCSKIRDPNKNQEITFGIFSQFVITMNRRPRYKKKTMHNAVAPPSQLLLQNVIYVRPGMAPFDRGELRFDIESILYYKVMSCF